MTEESTDHLGKEEQLNEIIARYLQTVEAGQKPDTRAFIARYPEYSAELEAFFADKERFNRFAERFQQASAGTVGLHGDEGMLPPSGVPFEAQAIDPTEAAGMSIGTSVRYFGDYELLGEIARGGMGVVFKARQVSLNRMVALKMILAGHLASKEDVQRFHTEAESAAQLDHPGIVPIFEIGEHEGQHYLSMGFVDGESLATKIIDGPLPPRQAAELVRMVAEAVQYAHGKGVIHRDLKPANVLLENVQRGERRVESPAGSGFRPSPLDSHDFRPRITDFGLSKRVEGGCGLTVSGQILGTPSYMPPEQAAGRLDQIKETADVYSLGAILYALLAGRPPFQADNRMDTLMQVLERRPVSPRLLNAKVPRDLETICLKCLEKDRRQRYRSAQELGEDLERFLRGKSIQARPISAPARVWRWCQRKPIVAALLAAVAFSMIAGTTISTHFAIEANQRAIGEAQQRELAGKREKDAVVARNSEAAARRLAEVRLAEGLVAAGDGFLASHRLSEARHRFQQAWQLARSLGLSEIPVTSGLLVSYAASPPPLLGSDGASGGIPAFMGHTEPITAMDITPDGRTAISASRDGTLRLWSITTGQEIGRLNGHAGPVTAVVFLPDGSAALAGGEDGKLILWDVNDGERLQTFVGHTGAIRSVTVSRDGHLAASAAVSEVDNKIRNALKLWKVDTGTEVRTFSTRRADRIFTTAFSPDGKYLLSGGWVWGSQLWDVESGEVVRKFSGHHNPVQCATFSPDGQHLLTGSWDKTLKLWDVATGRLVRTYSGHVGNVNTVAFSSNGQFAISGCEDKTLKLWNVTTGELLGTYTGHTSPVSAVRFVQGDQIAISAGADNCVKLWQLDPTREVPTCTGHTKAIEDAVLTEDGLTILSGGFDKSLRLWDAVTGLELRKLAGHQATVHDVDISPDGRIAVSASHDQVTKLWDVYAGRETQSFVGQGSNVLNCTLLLDGRSVLTGSSVPSACVLTLWDIDTGNARKVMRGHTNWISSSFSSHDGRTLFSTSGDRTLRQWDADSGEEIQRLESTGPMFTHGALSADDQLLLLGDSDGGLTFCEYRKSPPKRHRISGHGAYVTAVAIESDAHLALTAGRDGKVILWDVPSRSEIRMLDAHSDRVVSVAVAAEGKRFISASFDRTIRIWDLQRPEQYASLSAVVVKAQAALTVNPSDPRALSAFGNWYAFRGADDWATEFLEGARHGGANVSSLTLARCYWRLGKQEDAHREFQLALERKEAPEPYLTLCMDAVIQPVPEEMP